MQQSQETEKKRRKRPQIDYPKTLQRYQQRIQMFDADVFKEHLDDACILIYDVFEFVSEADGVRTNTSSHACNHAYILLSVARAKGSTVLGVSGAQKKGGELVMPLPEGARGVFVGAHNHFTGFKVHPLFSIKREDKVFVKPDGNQP